ncbi:MAG: hypothetical protein ACJ8FY_01700 [Gemmataceae bacterium]
MGRPNAFDGMMHEFCVGLGWCGCIHNDRPIHVTDFIPETGPVSAEEFAKWLIMADGLAPDHLSPSEIRRWMPQLKAVFVKHMGADVIDASKLRSE